MTIIVPYSNEWWEARRGKITASSRLHVAIYGTKAAKNQMLDDMKAELQPGFQFKPISSETTDWGHRHEPVARRHIEFRYDIETTDPGFLIHAEVPILAATPDYAAGDYLGQSISGEIKCPFKLKNHLKLSMGLRTKPEYETQVQGQLLITGADVAWFTSFHPQAPIDIQLYREIIHPDVDLHEKMLYACAELERMLKADSRYGIGTVKSETGVQKLW